MPAVNLFIDMSIISELYKESCRTALDEPICEWLKCLPLPPSAPRPGKYEIEEVPYMREPMEMWQQGAPHILTIGPNQGGRTTGQTAAMIWSLAKRTSPTQWNMDCEPNATAQASERFYPMINCVGTKPTKETPEDILKLWPIDSSYAKKQDILWNTGVVLHIQHASEGNLQSNSFRFQFNDEIYRWRPGLLGEAHRRVTGAYALNGQIWDGSIPGLEKDVCQAYGQWIISSQAEWSFSCRKCDTMQPFRWMQVKWDTNEKTRPGGKIDEAELSKTVRYQCANPQCNEIYQDTERERISMNARAKYVHRYPYNRIKGYRFNVLAVNWAGVTWAKQVVQFIEARQHAKRFGDTLKLQQFFQRSLAEWPAEEDLRIQNRAQKTHEVYSIVTTNWKTARWEDEKYRFLGADVQETYLRYVIRAFKPTGDSRLIAEGKAHTYEELALIADGYDVIRDDKKRSKLPRTIIDCSYKSREVYLACIKFGFLAFRGEDKDEGFTHRIDRPNQESLIVKRPYSKPIILDPMGDGSKTGKFCTVIGWSNLQIKDQLDKLVKGQSEVKFDVPQELSDDYKKEMSGETRTTIDGKVRWSNRGPGGKGSQRPNHAWDCECQILTAAIMSKLLTESSE